MGQITQENQMESDFGGVYGAKEFFIGENGETRKPEGYEESDRDISISKQHFLEMCAIVSNMFCDKKMNLREDSFLSPNPIFQEFNMIMNSETIKAYFKKNASEYEKRYNISKYPFDPQNSKMIQFFRMLLEQSPRFKSMFGEVVSDVVQDIISLHPRLRIVSFNSKLKDGNKLVGFTETPNQEFLLYKRCVLTIDDWKRYGNTLCYNCQGRDNQIEPSFLNGPVYGFFSTIVGDAQECFNEKYGYRRGYAFTTKYSESIQRTMIGIMASKYLSLTMPFFEKFNEMEKDIQTVPLNDGIASGLINALDQTV